MPTDSNSSSSSDEEDKKRRADLLKSVDKSRLNEKLFNGKESSCSKKEPLNRPEEDIDSNNHILSTGTRKHIARRLDRILDAKLKKSLDDRPTEPPNPRHENLGGVQLFSESRNILSDEEVVDSTIQTGSKEHRRKRKVSCISNKEMCRKVAVSTDWILSGECVKGWSKDTKGSVTNVKKIKKLENGGIECKLLDS